MISLQVIQVVMCVYRENKTDLFIQIIQVNNELEVLIEKSFTFTHLIATRILCDAETCDSRSHTICHDNVATGQLPVYNLHNKIYTTS